MLHKEAQVEIPIAQHRETFIEVADAFMDCPTVNKRNRRKKIVCPGCEQVDVFDRQVMLAAVLVNAALIGDFFKNPCRLSDDPLHIAGWPFVIEELDAGPQEIRFPRVVVVVNYNEFARRGFQPTVGSVLHSLADGMFHDLQPTGILRGMLVEKHAEDVRIAAVIDNDVKPVGKRLIQNRLEAAAQHHGTVLRAGDDRDAGALPGGGGGGNGEHARAGNYPPTRGLGNR